MQDMDWRPMEAVAPDIFMSARTSGWSGKAESSYDLGAVKCAIASGVF